MKEEFEAWAEGKIALANYKGEYANLDAQLAWGAWQRAWMIAVREQRRKDEEEIIALKHKINVAVNILESKI